MADNNKIPLEIEVDGVEQSIESLKDLKQAIKAAKDEQVKAASVYGESSKEFIEASKNVSKLKDKVEDLNDSTKSLKGSGVERASEGFNQLGEGLRNLDFDKVKVGLVAMKSALAAVGIGLIVQAVTYLVENFDELSKGSGLLAKALQFIGSIVTGLKDAFLKFGDILQGINPELRGMSTEIDKLKESMNGLLSEQMGRLDRLIAVTKANGESTIAYENLKQEAIIKTNKLYVDSIISYVKAGGQLTEEQKKQLTVSLENIKNAKTQQTVLEITENKKQLDDYKKHLADKKKADDEYARLKFEREQLVKADIDANIKREEDRIKKQQEDEKQAYEDRKLLDILIQEEKDKRNKEASDKKRKQDEDDLANAKRLKEEEQKFAVDVTNKSLVAAQSLSDLYYANKLSGVKKGSAEELKIAKQQFETNKKIQLAQATIQGVQAVLAAYSSGAAIPIVGAVAGPAYAALAGVVSAINIAKIASSKFEGGGASSPATGGGGSPSLPSIAAPPTIQPPNNNSTLINGDGSNGGQGQRQNTNQTITVNATVGVDEITDKSNRVKVLEQQSTF